MPRGVPRSRGPPSEFVPSAIVRFELRSGVRVWRAEFDAATPPLQLSHDSASYADDLLALNLRQATILGFEAYFKNAPAARQMVLRFRRTDVERASVDGDIPLRALPTGLRPAAGVKHPPLVCARPGWGGATLHVVLVEQVCQQQWRTGLA